MHFSFSQACNGIKYWKNHLEKKPKPMLFPTSTARLLPYSLLRKLPPSRLLNSPAARSHGPKPPEAEPCSSAFWINALISRFSHFLRVHCMSGAHTGLGTHKVSSELAFSVNLRQLLDPIQAWRPTRGWNAQAIGSPTSVSQLARTALCRCSFPLVPPTSPPPVPPSLSHLCVPRVGVRSLASGSQ